MHSGDIILLLPRLPRTATIVGPDREWCDSLAVWGVHVTADNPEAAVGAGARAAPGRTAMAALVGRTPVRAWRRAGYSVLLYRLCEELDGTTRLDRRPRFEHAVTAARERRRCGRRDVVLVAARGTALPAPVAAALEPASVREVVFSPEPRRRAAFFVATRGRRVTHVVKCARSPGEGERAAAEQAALAAVHAWGLGRHAPRALGHGDVDGVAWSLESRIAGVPMARATRVWRRRHGFGTLDALAAWLEDLGDASAHPPGAIPAGVRLPLTGTLEDRFGSLREQAAAVAAVMTHGDLTSGENVLVRGASFGVIDWETSVRSGFALLDLLPTLALGAARIRVASDPDLRADYVVRLCRGDSPDSAWLFGHIRRYLRRLDIPVASAGPLGALAWAHQASMRVRHDDLVRSAGRTPPAWRWAAELVADRWLGDDRLGPEWPALARATGAGT